MDVVSAWQTVRHSAQAAGEAVEGDRLIKCQLNEAVKRLLDPEHLNSTFDSFPKSVPSLSSTFDNLDILAVSAR